MVMKGAMGPCDVALPCVPDAEGIPHTWMTALERFHRSTQSLQEAYHALQKQVHALNLELQETNQELQDNLREKERLQSYLSHILEGLSVGVMVSDLRGRITLANRAARDLLELQDDVKGKSVQEELSGRFSFKDVETLTKRAREEGVLGVECCLRRRGGEDLQLTLQSHPLLDPSGMEIGMLVTVEDFTELRYMEEEVARSQRLAAMGEMAASIVHEVRNPLGSIQLFVSLMAREASETNREDIMKQIHSAVEAVDHILANLLTFAKSYKPRPAWMSPGILLEECCAFVRPLAQQHHIRIALETPEDIPEIEADRDLLKQAILNILLNAVQAMPDGGEMKARLMADPPSVRGREGKEGHEHKWWVDFGIWDTGEGIPREVLPSVFDPFFTTRSQGTGLGLAIVHNIIKAHGGNVKILSEPGEGTCVRLRIPIRRDED
jgi:PAS domain S-box-containing protein